jgi:6-phosphofructokinase 2
MVAIATFTANPAIDVSTSVGKIVPICKLRCAPARRDPGGGGINVARVVKRLGGDTTALYPVGGSIGELLSRLVDREKGPERDSRYRAGNARGFHGPS